VLDYLGRYTHRVAISNQRLLALEDGRISFSWKDYRDSSQSKVRTLEAEEFIRRFLTHVLPDSFQKIRYFGLMANRGRAANLALCRMLIPNAQPGAATLEVQDSTERYRELTGEDARLCPACKRGRMIPMLELPPVASERTKSVTPYDSS